MPIDQITTASIQDGAVVPADLSTGAPTWDTSGNVGIGTSSPGTRLDVNGSIRGTGLTVNGTDIVAGANQTAIDFLSGTGSRIIAWGANTSTRGSLRIAMASSDASAYLEAATIDSSGNVGIGTSSPGARLVVNGSTGMIVQNNADASNPRISLTPVSGGPQTITPYGDGDANEQQLAFCSGVIGAERARIDSSGNLLVGLTSTSGYLDGKTNVVASGTQPGICAKLDPAGNTTQFVYSAWAPFTTGNNVFMSFETETSATVRGSISYNRGGGLVAYNTTSDYRAKTVKGNIENALSKVALLKPCTGRMNDGEIDIDFFVAHELQEVVPSAVTGEKDALKEDGTPDYQMVDKSALIPLLTAAIQEQQQMIEELKAEVAALKEAK